MSDTLPANSDAVAGGQQVGQVEQKRSDQVVMPKRQYQLRSVRQRFCPAQARAQQSRPSPTNRNAAGQVRGLGTALGTAGRLAAAEAYCCASATTKNARRCRGKNLSATRRRYSFCRSSTWIFYWNEIVPCYSDSFLLLRTLLYI